MKYHDNKWKCDCRDKEEMLTRIISEYSNLVQKENENLHDWVEMRSTGNDAKKTLKFQHTNKWYMHKPVFLWKLNA